MKDRTILHLITLAGFGGWAFFFRRKAEFKDWIIIYLCKTLVSTLLDGPVVKKKYVQYPYRYFAKSFDSNIVFLYLIFPLLCVMYNQFVYKMKPLKANLSVFLFSAPMTLFEAWLEKNTKIVKYNKGWNGFFTFSILTFTFLLVRAYINIIRFIDKKMRSNQKPLDQ